MRIINSDSYVKKNFFPLSDCIVCYINRLLQRNEHLG